MKIKYLLLILSIVITACNTTDNENKETETKLKILWHFDYELAGYPESSPLIIENTVFMIGDEFLNSLELETGKLKWRSLADPDRALRGKKILNLDEHIVIAHYDYIRSWHKDSGKELWRFDYSKDLEPRLNGNVCVTENGFAFNSFKGLFFVLNKLGGLDLVKELHSDYSVMGLGYEEGRLFIGQRKTVTGALTLGRITALDAQTGDSLWAFDTDQGGFTWSPPIVENGILYASTIGNSPGEIAIALHAETGEEIWRQTNEVYTFNSALGPDHYYINTSGSLAALDKQTGRINWRVDWEGSDFNKPVYLAGYVYHVRDKELLVIDDANGDVVYKERVPDGTYFWHVAASSDKIFAQTSRQLIAYQPWHLRED